MVVVAGIGVLRLVGGGDAAFPSPAGSWEMGMILGWLGIKGRGNDGMVMLLGI